jgi:hypothetical protein
MEKIYVRFGDFSKNDSLISCYEAVFDNHIIKIIMPKFTYLGCQSIAKNVDTPAFLVDGTFNGKAENGQPVLSNIKIKIPLTFDKELENYTCDVSIPSKRNRLGDIKLPKWFK